MADLMTDWLTILHLFLLETLSQLMTMNMKMKGMIPNPRLHILRIFRAQIGTL